MLLEFGLMLASQQCMCPCTCDAGVADSGFLDASAPADSGVSSGSCNRPQTYGLRENVPITVNGATRYYTISVLSTYDPTRPTDIVIGLHGCNFQGFSYRRDLAMIGQQLEADYVAAGRSAIFLYPTAPGPYGSCNYFGWDPDVLGSGAQATALIDTLIDRFLGNTCPGSRVVMHGNSNGGGYAMRYGCFRGAGLAGVAVNAPYGSMSPPCSSVPILIDVNGDDPVAPPSMAAAYRDVWRQANGGSCTQTPQGICTIYRCASSSVDHCVHPPPAGGHWPSSNVGHLMWSFIRDRSRP